MSQSVRHRLMKGFAAQGFAQVTNLIIQFGSIPLFLLFWGKPLYGEWILLSTIPSYFALSDLGFANAAGTEMTLRVGRGDRDGALKVFQSAWILVTGVSMLITLTMLAAVSFLPITHWLPLPTLTHHEIVTVISILVFQVFFDLQTGLIGNGYRCDGHFAAGTMVRQVQRLVEFAVAALVLLLGGKLIALALAVMLTRLTGNLLSWFDVRRRSPWLKVGWKHADRETLRLITSPALSFMGFPVGHALSLSGINTVVGITLGPDVLPAFTTSRTLTRAVWQVLNAITNTIWVELSAAFGSGNLALARSLHRRACQAALWLALLFSIFLFFAGPSIYHIWTGRQIVFDPVLFGLLLGVGIANSLWSTSYVVLLAVNRHQQLAVVYVAATGLSLGLAYVLTPLMGLHGTAVSLLVIDLFMSSYVVVRSLALVEDTLPAFVGYVLTPPVPSLVRGPLARVWQNAMHWGSDKGFLVRAVPQISAAASVHLDAIRGLAALLVFGTSMCGLFFVPGKSVAHQNPLTEMLYSLGSFGNLAVVVFFVLSGFLVSSHIFRSLEANRWNWGGYAKNRLTRLYVVLLPALLLGAFWDRLGMSAFGRSGVYGNALHYAGIAPDVVHPAVTWESWCGSLLFLQTILVPPFGSNAALWSLSSIFWCYLLFPLCLLLVSRQPPGPARVMCGVAAILVAAFVGKGTLLLFPIWLMGTALCILPRARQSIRRWLCPLASLLLLAAALLVSRAPQMHSEISSGYLREYFWEYLREYLLAGAFTFFLYGVLGSRKPVPALYERLARFFAGISYSLYLLHLPFLFFVAAFVIGPDQRWQPDFLHLGLGLIVTAAAFCYTCLIWLLTEANTDQVRQLLASKLSGPVRARVLVKKKQGVES